jgi:TRAP-type mannitol/chloroaromatic compound transport system permease small subunit
MIRKKLWADPGGINSIKKSRSMGIETPIGVAMCRSAVPERTGRANERARAVGRSNTRQIACGANGGRAMAMTGTGPEPGWVRATAGVVAMIDALCRWSGYIVAWAALATVILCFSTVYLRYVMGTGSVWLQESYIWTHVVVIVLGAGYTMMTGGFVRVDVLYSHWSVRRKALSDMLMTIFLLVPFLIVFGMGVWTFWTASYASDEGSLNPGGLSDLWILKGTLLGFLVLIALQGAAFVLRGVLVLAGHEHYALNHGGHGADQTA